MNAPLIVEPDRYRLSATYDEHGAVSGVDIIVNADLSVGELAVLADCLRRDPGPLRGAPSWDSVTVAESDDAVIRTFNAA